MADDKTKVGGQDIKRINLNDNFEVSTWATALSITGDQLRKAVAAAGDRVDQVREYLDKK